MRYLSTTEAATILHVDPSRVRLLCKRGRIRTIKVGGTYAIPEGELARFAALPRRPGRPRRRETTSLQATAAVAIGQGGVSSQYSRLHPSASISPEESVT